MKKFSLISFVLLFVLATFSTFAQTENEEKKPCSQDKAEKLQLIKEAKSNQYRIRRIEMVGNNTTRHRVFVKRMAFVEGDLFTEELLEKTIKNLSKLKVIYPIGLENVEVHLDNQTKDVDLVFCVVEKKKK